MGGIEDEREQDNCESQASRYPIPKLEPYRIERDLPTEFLSLDEPPDKEVGQDRHHRAKHQLNHDEALSLDDARTPTWTVLGRLPFGLGGFRISGGSFDLSLDHPSAR